MAQGKQVQIEVSADKVEYLKQIAALTTDSLKILADKAKKPGIEGKLKMFQHMI